MAAAGTEAFTGEVVSVDPAAGTLTVKEIKDAHAAGEPRRMAFAVARSTAILRGSAAQQLRDLRPRESVTVRYSRRDGKSLAERVEILTPGATASSNASPKPAPAQW